MKNYKKDSWNILKICWIFLNFLNTFEKIIKDVGKNIGYVRKF